MNAPLRRLVRERAHFCCEYCLLPEAALPVRHHIDHIVARQHNGTTAEDNLALACYRCNGRKLSNLAGIDPTTGLMTKASFLEGTFRVDWSKDSGNNTDRPRDRAVTRNE
jgi:hypothetical protein